MCINTVLHVKYNIYYDYNILCYIILYYVILYNIIILYY